MKLIHTSTSSVWHKLSDTFMRKYGTITPDLDLLSRSEYHYYLIFTKKKCKKCYKVKPLHNFINTIKEGTMYVNNNSGISATCNNCLKKEMVYNVLKQMDIEGKIN